MYEKYFNIKFLERDESWAPHTIHSTCYLMLYKWEESENNASLKFIVPVIWEKPQNERNYYFCMNDAKKWGIFNKKPITHNSLFGDRTTNGKTCIDSSKCWHFLFKH